MTFIEALEDAGLQPSSYSGRGMYGKQCVSVVSPDPSFVSDVIENLIDNATAEEERVARWTW